MIRLDVFVAEQNNISRESARRLILEKKVLVDGVNVIKPSFKVCEQNTINIIGQIKYVSRGGYKLEKAINHFDIKLFEKVCIDVGASTGGFTDCMLQNHASKVYAVDVGHSQMVEKLLQNPNVISMEKTNIKDAVISEQADFISVDVSFVSLTKILDYIYPLLKDQGEVVCLVKPQFEAGRQHLNKRGIVTNPKVHKKVLDYVINYANQINFFVNGLTFSDITGGDGNIEYLLYLKKSNQHVKIDIDKIVESAFEQLK